MQFRRADRLIRKADFDLVLTQGTVRVASGPFRAFACPTLPPGDGARLGLIVGKRQLSRAVDRNRVKRCVRESFRASRAGLPALDVVVRLARTPEPGTDLFEALGQMWTKLIRAAGAVDHREVDV